MDYPTEVTMWLLVPGCAQLLALAVAWPLLPIFKRSVYTCTCLCNIQSHSGSALADASSNFMYRIFRIHTRVTIFLKILKREPRGSTSYIIYIQPFASIGDYLDHRRHHPMSAAHDQNYGVRTFSAQFFLLHMIILL